MPEPGPFNPPRRPQASDGMIIRIIIAANLVGIFGVVAILWSYL